MRRVLTLYIMAGMLMALSGCGNNHVGSVTESESGMEGDTESSIAVGEADVVTGILPTRIDKGGTIPEGCEAKHAMGEADYRLEMLWGTWVSETGQLPNLHDGYVDALCHFGEDGSLTIESDYADSHTYAYLYSGDSLTLISDDNFYVYSLYTYELESPLWNAVYKVDAGEETFRLSGGETLGDFIGKGFTADYDLTQAMVSCQVSELLSLRLNGSSMNIKVVNPYEKPIPLAECRVCAIYINDESGELSIDGHWTEIGQTTYDEVDFLHKPAYEKTDSMLRYKGAGIRDIVPLQSYGDYLTNRRLLDLHGDTEVIYDFKNSILTGYRLEIPALLYNGLQDNVDASILVNMKPAEFSGMVEVRDTVLDRLKASFQSAGVNVNINDATGEIVLDNDILFGFDETVLSDEEKQYIDDFMGIYASVITDSGFQVT